MLALWESSAGDLWAGSLDGGVSRYRDGRFTAYSTNDGLTSNVIRRIDEDAAGAIWLYHDSGLSTWRDGRWDSVAPPAPPFPDCPMASSFPAVTGEFLGYWCWNDRSWARFAYGRWSELPLPPEITNPRTLKVGWIVEDAQRRIWFTLLDRPGESYCVSNGRLTVLRGLARHQRVFYQDRRGVFWTNNSAGQVSLWKDGLSRVFPGSVSCSSPLCSRIVRARCGLVRATMASCAAGCRSSRCTGIQRAPKRTSSIPSSRIAR